jgi:glycosyltransferase involved in cell wall biosynthesis
VELVGLRVAMFSTMVTGGAGYAALRVHDALRLCGAVSTLYVSRNERSKHPGVERLSEASEGPQPPRIPGQTIFSVDAPGISDPDLDRVVAGSDVFNLHWYARFVSLQNIERLSRSGKPVILTIRDMNPVAGGCHFFHGCENWKKNCDPCPQFVPANLPLPNATFEAKRVLFNLENISVVVLSEHTRSLVEKSPILRGCRIEKIPNPIDTSIFRPVDKQSARSAFHIPAGKQAIAYLPSFGSSVKGSTQATAALRALAQVLPPESCVIVCAGDLDRPLDVPFETINPGFIADKHELARFYSCADVTLIPSTEETFSNTAAESLACGTPVVGFRVGVIPEIAEGPRGRAVPVNDVEALASALAEVLTKPSTPPAELHRFTIEAFNARTIGGRYLQLFEELHVQATAREKRSLGTAPRGEAVARLDRLLSEYRAERSIELQQEREDRKRQRRSLRGWLAVVGRAARLLVFDNRAFRRQVRSLLQDRR